MLRRFFAPAIVCALLAAAPAAAQEGVTGFTGGDVSDHPFSGWVFTPTLVYSAGYDDNVLLRGQGDNVQGDLLNAVTPRADLSYQGKRTQFVVDYSGGFQMYRQFGSLDSYDQNASLLVQRKVTKHLTLFVRESFSASPTTAVIQIVGVPFIRTGADFDSLKGGFENQFSKRLTVSGTYDFEWVKFDSAAYGTVLVGGHSNGASVSLKYQLDERTALTGDGDAQFAIVDGPLQFVDVQYAAAHGTLQNFTTENAWVGVERKLTETLRVFAAGGISHLQVTNFLEGRTGPAWRFGASKTYGQTFFDVGYTRSFVPSFGFGGTLQNEDLSAHVRTPLTRRIYASGGMSWMRNEPLVPGQLSLHSVWSEATVGYTVSPWLHVEAFYGGIHQSIDRPGGILDRNQFGIQVVTAKPMRIH